ncbi:isocitrate lyase/phosphoenolpyruvate mutase family protein [Streptomyces sodiiphilus]|uniref:Isocitrate lyase/phosphoenolpyruvate mutase family protein n=1 Tax=Streptomyces sodiiphilus TaxID=226217 RepID=A0ABN2P942_9ACTN
MGNTPAGPATSSASVQQTARAERFRALHTPGTPLVLPNAWDAASALLVEHAGAHAVATSSSGASWSMGAADGEQLDRHQTLELISRITATVDVPVTADIEGGYAQDPAGVGETVRLVLAAGAVGVNLEDARQGGPAPLRPVAEQAARLAAARRAADAEGIPLFLNARLDTYLFEVGEPETRLARTLERARAYREAGADGIFVPGVTDLPVVAALAEGIDAPLNVLAGPGSPPVADLAAAGAARVSVGGSLAAAAYGLAHRAARELLTTGTCDALADGISMDPLLAPGRATP